MDIARTHARLQAHLLHTARTGTPHACMHAARTRRRARTHARTHAHRRTKPDGSQTHTAHACHTHAPGTRIRARKTHTARPHARTRPRPARATHMQPVYMLHARHTHAAPPGPHYTHAAPTAHAPTQRARGTQVVHPHAARTLLFARSHKRRILPCHTCAAHTLRTSRTHTCSKRVNTHARRARARTTGIFASGTHNVRNLLTHPRARATLACSTRTCVSPSHPRPSHMWRFSAAWPRQAYHHF
jgi:hypothetical protein